MSASLNASAEACATDTREIVLLPREVRMVVERMLLLTRTPPGAIPAVRDVVLYSAAAGLGGLVLLQERFAALREAPVPAPRITETAPGQLEVQGGGAQAWLVLPAILDALGEAAARHGAARARIQGVADPLELRTACATGPALGLAITAEGDTLSATPAAGARDETLERVLRDGVPVSAGLWWTLHHLSNSALAQDTPESRRHAGPVIVEADGRVIGRSDHDDDTDFSLLTSARTDTAHAH